MTQPLLSQAEAASVESVQSLLHIEAIALDAHESNSGIAARAWRELSCVVEEQLHPLLAQRAA